MQAAEKRMVADRLNAWLERYQPPRYLTTDEALQEEADTLLRVLLRTAPPHGVDLWIGRVLDLLDERARTRAWPMASEVKRAGLDARSQVPVPEGSGCDGDVGSWGWSLKVRARRVNEGAGFGEGDLWGRDALEMLRTGAVSQDVIAQRRRELVARWIEVYGEEAARRRLEEFERLHDGAVRVMEAREGPGRAGLDRGALQEAVARVLDAVAAARGTEGGV
ncbi:hypothetical protein SAMN05216257_104105 [Meinhardsimonia xiamenensis]|jgi:hypothetical protein|uniref:Uncharacterized protein n=1 Tax=Meinhardsimonia xiamenensis TaxID=990712 RepID=A0A1G9E0Y7_9RHOB|nr:hypothetical protein [Meinhardsimonia xiamenensis]PRX33970.1 hypothetical protein LV81_02409 [Meinhardsimonia xiamenensis]SDK69763.1 hypothetical protein SAMN05216257_104105 [Meinhardsimonia xiamenensis]